MACSHRAAPASAPAIGGAWPSPKNPNPPRAAPGHQTGHNLPSPGAHRPRFTEFYRVFCHLTTPKPVCVALFFPSHLLSIQNHRNSNRRNCIFHVRFEIHYVIQFCREIEFTVVSRAPCWRSFSFKRFSRLHSSFLLFDPFSSDFKGPFSIFSFTWFAPFLRSLLWADRFLHFLFIPSYSMRFESFLNPFSFNFQRIHTI